MNNKIFIIAHAPLASALRDCALHVFPDSADRLLLLDVVADAPCDQTFAKARARADAAASNLLVLTDVFGATPSNVAQRLLDYCSASGIQVREVTGVNLPMVLRALCHVAQPLDMLEQSALVGGGQGIFTVDAATGSPVCSLLPDASKAPGHNAGIVSDSSSAVSADFSQP